MKELTRFEKLIFVLSSYVVVELYVGSLIVYSQVVQLWIGRFDFLICILFLYDFFSGLYKSENKGQFLKGHWVDFISSIPMVGFLRVGRVVRIIRVLRVLRSGRVLYRFLNKERSFSTFGYVVLLNILFILLSSLSLYQLEHQINPDIQTLGDSVWWSVITTTTLGFVRDVVPLTIEGKVFSVILIGMGILLFGTFTGMVTDYFVGDEDIRKDIKGVSNQLDRIEKKLDDLLTDKNKN
ncbi:MAG: potassium channel family protein [Candidatus Marinimicrobia bacterium]|nr:potassium channel family protein [Candidatus Neomarinimicrobiota bacterium]